ncbi:hypothetical protein HF086_017266 [Spodoptera exigua]|uniref:Uncharacterized protein n=1 Tax=Spodoptera exigua TaxID=7107 RepID=A0A922S8H3_SPOEX|nr:hypothetical protein HF086_017266 [Spodoptera exigua]
MSQQLELLTESPLQWTAVSLLTPEIQKKEIKPFVILALKELEGNPDSRTSSLMNTDKFAAVREVVRHFSRLRQSTISSENPSQQRAREIMHRDTHVILILQLTDGRTNSYRLSYDKFHELRYIIASALKSMIVLEKRKCMRRE